MKPALILWALATSVSAATFTVTNTNDSGPGSLRQALTDAQGCGGPDIHASSPSLGGHTIAFDVPGGLLTNGVATLLFAMSGKVDLRLAALMAVASMVGGFLGALLAQRLPPAGMRGFAIAVGLFAAGKMFFR